MYNILGLIYSFNETKHQPVPPPCFTLLGASWQYRPSTDQSQHILCVLCDKEVTPRMQGFESTQCRILLCGSLSHVSGNSGYRGRDGVNGMEACSSSSCKFKVP